MPKAPARLAKARQARDGGGRTGAAGPELRIAAASDLQAVFPRLAARFEAETGRHLAVTFGSSGNFFSQIQNGAPFDLFLSADADYPRRLVAAGLAYPDGYGYATGRLVVWARKDAGIDLRAGLRALVDPRVRRIAIANPDHAPYGRAAIAALRHEGIYETVKSRLVLGENISQAAQFVASGNADAGVLALSLALAPALRADGTYADVPSAFHPPIDQVVVVLTHSRDVEAARRFLAFLARPDTVRLLEQYGFTRPSSRGR
jgi:molybdate transport system substrate-binding protein